MALAGLNSGGILHSTQQQCGGSIPLAIAINSLWLLMALVPFALVIRYGVRGQNSAGFPQISATFQRHNLRRHF